MDAQELKQIIPVIVLKLILSIPMVFVPLFIAVTISKFFSDEAIFLENKNLDRFISVVSTLMSIAIALFFFQVAAEDSKQTWAEREQYQQWCSEAGGFYQEYQNKCQK